jgi:hypothetical protein
VSYARRALFVIAAGVWLVARPAAGSAQDSVSSAPPSVAPLTVRMDSACAGCPRKRPLTAVLMGLATNVFINRFDTWVLNVKDPPPDNYYTRVTTRSWGVNIRKGWVWDTDAFPVNMFMHPIQGGTYFRAGRSNGLDFWESVPLSFLGSAEWEYFGETTFPSLNDFYNTGFGGIVVGETFYRLVAVIRDNTARGTARLLRELAAFPLDPAGSVKRVVSGEAWRVYTNPGEHEPPPLALQLQAGLRLATDSGPSGKRSVKGVLVAELAYGDAFETPYTRPFDVFLLRGLLSPSMSPGVSSVGEARVAGRLYAHELTYTSAPIRTIFTVRQKIEYTESPAFKFGGQSVEAGLVTRFDLGNGVDVRAESFVEGIMLGAVDAPHFTTDSTGLPTGIAGSARTYDFGPGAGFDVSATLRVGGFSVLSARWHGALLHSVSGSPADHHTQFPSVEVAVPLTRTLGLGAYAGWYARRSSYFGNLGETKTYPDYRAYVVWQTRPRSAAPEAP